MSNHKAETKFIRIEPRRCRACWKCVDACPHKVIVKVGFFLHRHIMLTDNDTCVGCGKCIKACPHNVFSRIEPK